jgi:hypothetical protein
LSEPKACVYHGHAGKRVTTRASGKTAHHGALCLLLAASFAASAHHANSAYDSDRTISVTGTVTRWQFINPHAGLWVDVDDGQGNLVAWSGEFQGVLDLYRHFGWNKDTFKPGDRVTLIGNPARDGSTTLSARRVVLSDGQEVDVRSAPD